MIGNDVGWGIIVHFQEDGADRPKSEACIDNENGKRNPKRKIPGVLTLVQRHSICYSHDSMNACLPSIAICPLPHNIIPFNNVP